MDLCTQLRAGHRNFWCGCGSYLLGSLAFVPEEDETPFSRCLLEATADPEFLDLCLLAEENRSSGAGVGRGGLLLMGSGEDIPTPVRLSRDGECRGGDQSPLRPFLSGGEDEE